MNKKYRLKHDLLSFKKDDLFTQENSGSGYYNVNGHSWHERIHHFTIERNPGSFEEVTDNIQGDGFVWTDELVGEYGEYYRKKQGVDYTTWGKCLLRAFKQLKSPPPKEDISSGEDWLQYISSKPKEENKERIEVSVAGEKFYSQSQMDEARREAFGMAREADPNKLYSKGGEKYQMHIGNAKYPTYEDYIKTTKQQTP